MILRGKACMQTDNKSKNNFILRLLNFELFSISESIFFSRSTYSNLLQSLIYCFFIIFNANNLPDILCLTLMIIIPKSKINTQINIRSPAFSYARFESEIIKTQTVLVRTMYSVYANQCFLVLKIRQRILAYWIKWGLRN